MSDAKEQVKAATTAALTATFAVNGNRDITQFLPALIGCIARPVSAVSRVISLAIHVRYSLSKTVPASVISTRTRLTSLPLSLSTQAETTDCIHKLAATTFVQQVEGGPLSIIVPLLVRGLRERTTAIKRKSAVIIDNMAKLVENPHDAAPFLPKLLPELDKVANEVADPECRKVASNAHATLMRTGGEGKLTAPKKAETEVLKARLVEGLGAKASSVEAATLSHAAALAAQLCNFKNWMTVEWHAQVGVALSAFVSEAEAKAAASAALALLG
jgi:elongation factor 3